MYSMPYLSSKERTAGTKVRDMMSALNIPNADKKPNCVMGTIDVVHREINDTTVVSPAMITGKATR